MRKEILNALADAIKNTDKFKKVIKGVLPPVPNINSFPAIALAIDKENRERVNVPGCEFQSELLIVGIIYTKSGKTIYEDVISDLIYAVEEAIQTDETLNNLVIDIYVRSVAQDGGLLHPYQLCELDIVAYYRK
jgi:hypothetical protein